MNKSGYLSLFCALLLGLAVGCGNDPKPQDSPNSHTDTPKNKTDDQKTDDQKTDDQGTDDQGTDNQNTNDQDTDDGNSDECNNGYGKDCRAFGTMKDKANKSYKTIIIGGTEWMAENMAYQEDGEVTCDADTDRNRNFIADYGCLYTFEDAQKVCPTGWALPTTNDFQTLWNNAKALATDNSNNIATALVLIAKSTKWNYQINKGTDDLGFGALPAGYRNIDDGISTPGFQNMGLTADFWTSVESSEETGIMSFVIALMDAEGSAFNWINFLVSDPTTARSVRCVRTAQD